MSNPSLLLRLGFIASIGFLFVGVMFTVTHWPAASLFSLLGGGASLVFYVLFHRAATVSMRSDMARHVAFGSFIVGQVLRSFEVGAGINFFLVSLLAFLVWVTWSVLETLPPSEE